MRFFFLIVSLFSFSFVTFSQIESGNQFLVTEAQDTLYGYVRRTSEVLNIEQGVYYKPTKNAEESLYKMKDVFAYCDASKRIYYKKQIPHLQKDSVVRIVEVLFIGEVNLYSFGRYFYIEKDSTIYKLKDSDTDKWNEEGRLVRKNNREYVSILSVLLSECFEIYDEIIKAELDAQDLLPLLEDYHNCVNADYVLVAEYRKFEPSFDLGIFSGGFISSSSVKISTNRSNFVSGLKGYNLLFGVDARFKVNRLSRYYLVLSPQLSINNSYSYQSENFLSNTSSILISNDLVFEFSQVDLPFGLGYEFVSKAVQPSLSGGIIASRFWGGTYGVVSRITPLDGDLDNQRISGEYEGDISLDNSFGFWASFGVKYRLKTNQVFFTRIRYQIGDLDSDYGRVQNVEGKLNHHQYKIEFGLLF